MCESACARAFTYSIYGKKYDSFSSNEFFCFSFFQIHSPLAAWTVDGADDVLVAATAGDVPGGVTPPPLITVSFVVCGCKLVLINARACSTRWKINFALIFHWKNRLDWIIACSNRLPELNYGIIYLYSILLSFFRLNFRSKKFSVVSRDRTWIEPSPCVLNTSFVLFNNTINCYVNGGKTEHLCLNP